MGWGELAPGGCVGREVGVTGSTFLIKGRAQRTPALEESPGLSVYGRFLGAVVPEEAKPRGGRSSPPAAGGTVAQPALCAAVECQPDRS